MRDVGLAVALIAALACGWRLMGRLDDWLQRGRFQEYEDDEPEKRVTLRQSDGHGSLRGAL